MNSVIPGLTRIQQTEIQPKPIMACFERHWIPASAGMTHVLFSHRINSNPGLVEPPCNERVLQDAGDESKFQELSFILSESRIDKIGTSGKSRRELDMVSTGAGKNA